MEYTFIQDLVDRASELTQEGHPTEHVQGRAVFTDEHMKVLAFPFEEGQNLAEHDSPHPAVLHFIEGEADVTLGDDSKIAHAGTWIHLPPRLPHSIRARTSTLMLLIILRSVT